MSALRGRIIRSADVSACSEGRGTRAALRRARNGAAADALERAEAVLRGRLLIADERLRLFEEKLCEGMTALMLQAPLPEMNMPHTEWLNEIWILLRQQQSTRPLYLYMSASLSPFDRNVILDRVSSRIIDEGLAHSPPSK
jgi:hypothetical protein